MPTVVLAGGTIKVNAKVDGSLRVRVLDGDSKSIAGYGADDCMPIGGDSLAHVVTWKGSRKAPVDRPIQLEFLLHDARFYGFDLVK